MLVVYMVAVLGVFGYWLFWNRKAASAADSLSTLQASVKDLRQNEGKLALIKYKLEKVNRLLKQRADLKEVWNDVQDIVVDGVAISSLSISTDGNTVISGQVVDTDHLVTLENKIDEKGKFIKATLTSFAKVSNGYTFSISFIRKDKGGVVKQ